MFLLILLPLLGSFVFFYQAYKASKSGSTQQQEDGTTVDSDVNVPIYKTSQFAYAVILFLATIGVAIAMHLDK